MRIAHVIDHFQPWMGYQETHLARMQTVRGLEVLVITSSSPLPMVKTASPDTSYTVGRSLEAGINVHRLNSLIRFPTRAGSVWLAGLRKTLSDFQPDVVHVHVHSPIMLAALQVVLLKDGFGILIDSHLSRLNVFPEQESRFQSGMKSIIYRLFRRAFASRIAHGVDRMIAIGEAEQDFLHWLFPETQHDIPIIRLGADASRFLRDAKSRSSLRAKLGWQDHTIVIGHAGILRKTKRLHVLIQAFAKVMGSHPLARLYFIGNAEGHYEQELKRLCMQLRIDDYVAFQPFVDAERLPEYLNVFDIGVWPGDISITAIEAMAFGTPIIAARSDYTQAIIGQHEAGLLVEQDNVNDLELALRTLLDNQDALLAHSRNARRTVETTLNWQVIGEQFIQEYESIIANRKE